MSNQSPRILVLHLRHDDNLGVCVNAGMEWSVPVPEFQPGLIWIPSLRCTGGCDAEPRIVGSRWSR